MPSEGSRVFLASREWPTGTGTPGCLSYLTVECVKGGAKMYQSGESGVVKRRLQTVPPAAFHRVARNSMEGVKDVQGGYVRARPQGMYGRGYEHPGG